MRILMENLWKISDKFSEQSLKNECFQHFFQRFFWRFFRDLAASSQPASSQPASQPAGRPAVQPAAGGRPAGHRPQWYNDRPQLYHWGPLTPSPGTMGSIQKSSEFSDSVTEKLRNIFRYIVEINWKSVICVWAKFWKIPESSPIHLKKITETCLEAICVGLVKYVTHIRKSM